MGFGLISAGYSTMFFLRLVPVELFGFFFVLKGLSKLCGYNKFFSMAKKSVWAILAFSLADLVWWVLNFFGAVNIPGIYDIMTYIHRILLLPFHFFLFAALRDISNRVGYEKGKKRASLAMSTAIVYYLVFALSRISIGGFERYFILAEYIFCLLLIIITESAVLTCYKAITTDEAEEKEEQELAKFEARFGRNRKGTSAKK